MTLIEARDIFAAARRNGTGGMTPTEFATYEAAREMVHAHSMANDVRYARGYHDVYGKLSRINWRDPSFNTTTATD